MTEPKAEVYENPLTPKSCPFCGGAPKLGKVHSGLAEGWVIFCTRCKAIGPPTDNQGRAVQAWNRRMDLDSGLLLP
jgi:Lar family restriction alleviation protein